MALRKRRYGWAESEELEDEVTEEVEADEVDEDEDMDDDVSTDDVDPVEDSETLEDEVATNAEMVEEVKENVIEAESTPEKSDVPVDFVVEGFDDEVAEDFNKNPEETAKELEATGESFLAMAEDAEVEALVEDEDMSPSEAREELGLVEEEAAEDTEVSDAIVNTTFISSPSKDGENTLVIEKYDDEKGEFDYAASDNDFDDVANKEALESEDEPEIVSDDNEEALGESFFF